MPEIIRLGEAFALCHKAAETSYAGTQNNQAFMYANGHAVELDCVWPCAWLTLAAEQIEPIADLRNRIAKEMAPGQIADAKRLTEEKRTEMLTRKQ